MTMFISRIRDNWRSGITVALISIPLSISLAIASGATPAMGIITAVWAGLLASIFGGSHFNIVGPAGALSGLLAAFALTHGAGLLPMLALCSAVFIFVAYLFKLERYLVLVPATVMHGFSLGVALIIGLGQLNFALGLQNLPKHSEFIANVMTTFAHIPDAHMMTVAVTALFLVLLFAMVYFFPKIPAIIAVTPVGLALGYFGAGRLGIQTLGDRFSYAPLDLWQFPAFTFDVSILIPALGVAFIAILETLISAKIADMMTDTKFHARKEMLGLSLANIGSGFFGGLPATGVFVRTGLNVKTGANHATSAGINAVMVGIISVFFFTYFMYLPLAVIAAILLFASIRMIEAQHFAILWKHARRDFWLACITAIVMIGVDTVVGLLVGALLALLFFVEKLSQGQFEMTTNDEHHVMTHRYYEEKDVAWQESCDVIVYSMKGEFAYVNSDAHTERLEHHMQKFNTLVLRMRELAYIDLEAVHAFDHIVRTLEGRGKKVVISSVTQPVRNQLEKSESFRGLQDKGYVFETTRLALQSLGFPSEKNN